jgi:DNA-binding SARP family transcriptional activator
VNRERPARGAPSIDFRLLGPFEVRMDGQDVAIKSPKHRAMLAVLLLRAPRPVPTGELAEAIWDDADQPASPRRTVQLYAARLRDLLAIPGVISTWADGYQADVRPDQIDVGRFRQLLAAASKAGKAGALG